MAFEVYPDSEKLDIGENKLIAVFKFKEHANDYGRRLWGKFYIVKEVKSNIFDK